MAKIGVKREDVGATEGAVWEAYEERLGEIKAEAESLRHKAEQARLKAEKAQKEAQAYEEGRPKLEHVVKRWKVAVEEMEESVYDTSGIQLKLAVQNAERYEKVFKKLGLGWKVFW